MWMTGNELVQRIALRTHDFCELQEASAGWNKDYVQLSPGPFSGSIELVQTGTTQVFRERWGRKIRYRGTAPRGAFGFALTMQQPEPGNWLGRKVDRDTVILQAPDREADLVSPDTWDALVLSVAESDVHAMAAALSRSEDISGDLHGTIALPAMAAMNLRQLGTEILSRSKAIPPDCAKEVTTLSSQLIKEFVWEVIKARGNSEFFAEPTKPASLVGQATDIAMNDQSGRVGLADICIQIGISLRTLHNAFQIVAGMSPATWLRRLRLNQVHVILKQASPDEVLIKNVARVHGFLHVGHFGDQYRRLFGTLPGQTLKSA